MEEGYVDEIEKVRLGFDARLSYSDVAPLLNELNERIDIVETRRWNSEPPAAAGSEIVMSILLEAGEMFAAGFLLKFAKDAYVGARA